MRNVMRDVMKKRALGATTSLAAPISTDPRFTGGGRIPAASSRPIQSDHALDVLSATNRLYWLTGGTTMGAGNYFFSAPAGDAWSHMIYVALRPSYWDTVLEEREDNFKDHLQMTKQAERLKACPADCVDDLIEKIRAEWDEDHSHAMTEEDFHQEQTDFQLESIEAALHEAFHGDVTGSFSKTRRTPKIDDAYVIAEVGRMCIAWAYTYEGDRMALMVTPVASLQDRIYELEHSDVELERGRGIPAWALKQMRKDNLEILNLKRTLKSGALNREMLKTFNAMVKALHENGLASCMSYRSCAWTSRSYEGSETYLATEQQIEARAKRMRKSAQYQISARF